MNEKEKRDKAIMGALKIKELLRELNERREDKGNESRDTEA